MSAIQLNNYVPGNYTDTVYYNDYNEKVPLKLKVGDFTPFYITIAICSVVLGTIIILNIVCCCSRYSEYWLDRHTGNRWLVSVWSSSPHKQPPLDLTELTVEYEPVYAVHSHALPHAHPQPPAPPHGDTSSEYLELHKRESDL